MKKYTLPRLALAALLAALGILGALLQLMPRVLPAAAPKGWRLPILMYHSVLDSEAKAGKYIITPAELEDDLAFLRSEGYTAITVGELIAMQAGELPVPARPVMLTFDDGCYNNLSYVQPLLEKYDMKAVLSVVGRYADEASMPGAIFNNNYSYLNWEQLRALQAGGRIEVQSHSYNLHGGDARMGLRRPAGEAEGTYRQIVTADLRMMQKRMEAELGQPALCFTYPFGFITNEGEQIVRELGFPASLSCYERVSTITAEPGCLRELGRYNRAHGRNARQIFAKFAD